MEFDLVAHLERQREFSERKFGPGPRTKGVIDHIRKELTELEANPTDLYEWIDVVLLALDGAWRAGYSSKQIAIALETKQTMNEARNWPRWQDQSADKAIEHRKDRGFDGPCPDCCNGTICLKDTGDLETSEFAMCPKCLGDSRQ